MKLLAIRAGAPTLEEYGSVGLVANKQGQSLPTGYVVLVGYGGIVDSLRERQIPFAMAEQNRKLSMH